MVSAELPVESWGNICSYLSDDARAVASLACTCRSALESTERDEVLWSRLLDRDFKPVNSPKPNRFVKKTGKEGSSDEEKTASTDDINSGSGSDSNLCGDKSESFSSSPATSTRTSSLSQQEGSPPPLAGGRRRGGRLRRVLSEEQLRKQSGWKSWRDCYSNWARGKPRKESVFRNVHCLRNNENAVLYGSRVNALVLDASMRSCWSCGGDGVVQKWDMAREETVLSIRGVHQIPSGMSNFKQVNNMGVECADACGPNCLVTGGCDKGISLWDSRKNMNRVQGGHVEVWHKSMAHYDEVLSIACSRSEPLIVTGGADDCVRVWDMRWMDEALLELDTLHGGSVFSIAIDDDKRTVYTGSGDKTISLWDLRSGHWLSQAHGHTGDVYDIVLGEQRILSASDDGTVREWMVEGNREWFQELVCVSTLGITIDMYSDTCELELHKLSKDSSSSSFRSATHMTCLEMLGGEEKAFLGGTWSGDLVLGNLYGGMKAFSQPVAKNADNEEKDDYSVSHTPVTAIAATSDCVVTGFNNGAVRFSRM